MINQYIKDDLVFLNMEVSDKEDLFKKLNKVLLREEYVTGEFYDYILEREGNYPTGLKLEGYSVAIPHGNPEYVKKPFIAVITLNQPIKMNQMDDPGSEIDVELLFLLGLDNGSGHLKILKSIIKKIQNQEFVTSIIRASSNEELIALFK